jgi:murein DD-endopeptidase MepM/ murein hydrolase activator NlpD
MTKISRSIMIGLALPLLLLSACARSGGPAPVEHVGVGAGETYPGQQTGRTASASPDSYSSTYTPPPGYGAGASTPVTSMSSSGEPLDAYSQVAQPSSSQPSQMGAPAMTSSVGQVGELPPPASVGGPNTVYTNTPQPPAYTPSATEAAPMAAPAQGGALSYADSTMQGTGKFGWPMRGRIISEYGPLPNGQKNDGINIAAPMGAPVYASADGTVAYAGNELKGFGTMVLVKHDGGMFTVYAHLSSFSVAKGDKVSKGQPIGAVGQTGSVPEPQLHFEVRKGSTPLNPRDYLSQ